MTTETKTYDFLIAGGGIFGVSAAVELAKRKHRVALINPDTIPHHLAASTDISKAVRMEYGSDLEYFRMAEISIKGWQEWNDLLGVCLYHQTGFLMLAKETMDSPRQSFEKLSYDNLIASGYKPEVLTGSGLKSRFPAVNSNTYSQGCYNTVGGYVESSLAVEQLAKYAASLGVDIFEKQTAQHLEVIKGRLTAVTTREGKKFSCGHAHVAAGSFTPLLMPELAPYFKITGHPVFWLKPENPELFMAPNFTVFTADISNTGWYGFPYHEKNGVVKVARHSNGLELHPRLDDRVVHHKEIEHLRAFLKESLPELSSAPLVFTRRCLYTDTLDGHYWIDNHPEIKGLSVGTGGNGHGLKMAPMLGEMQADVAESGTNQFSDRYRWRHLESQSAQKEDARFVE